MVRVKLLPGMNESYWIWLKAVAIMSELFTRKSCPERQSLPDRLCNRFFDEVEAGMWDGVLVVEVERLARGDTIDQGTVSRAFQYSDTKIITPSKTYDPDNEFDEEYFEFGLFMSRREYKTIKRRLNAGRICFCERRANTVATKPPYGYERVKLQR